MSLDTLTAYQIRDRIRTGEISSVEATSAVFDRIDKRDPTIGAFISTDRQRALKLAARIDKRIAGGDATGPLGGVPIAIKDNLCTRFGKTTCGSKMLENFAAPYDAHVIEKLQQADAIIIGKCNMDEFAMGSSTENSSLKKTCNPLDTQRVPGGSSGGPAAAVADRMCFAALGSDTGGSIRQPAAFCGVVGLKPTYGRVSRYGLVAFGSSLDQIGPIGFDVADVALMLNTIAGHDPRDSTSVSEKIAPLTDYTADLDKPLDGLKIGMAEEFFALEGLDPQVAQLVRDAVKKYTGMGAKMVDVKLPHLKYAIATYYLIATAEASSNLARFDGVHYGHRTDNPSDYIDVYNASRQEGFGDEVKRRIMLGTYALSSGYYDAYYLKALKVRNLIRQDFDQAFEKVDCLMCPTTPEVAFKFGEKTDDPLKMYLSDIYTIPANLVGLPAISIPCGLNADHLPAALQIMTPAFTEHKLLRIARMFEAEMDIHLNRPRL
ncbi:MAG: Asp-tRNA(Asn)/Glu-tRNA(Gln) amidotransferase subunit GatA [Planctomycetes bacterium]|nr:Asp-tRNA(Asn)/Glu-tRNA(Gln) amidotransferase subunit GatA [Planctomycetota bacterium]